MANFSQEVSEKVSGIQEKTEFLLKLAEEMNAALERLNTRMVPFLSPDNPTEALKSPAVPARSELAGKLAEAANRFQNHIHWINLLADRLDI